MISKFLAGFLILILGGCGGTTSSAQDNPETVQLDQFVTDEVMTDMAQDTSANFQTAEKIKTIPGDTGTVVISRVRDNDESGKTRTRTLKYDKFTRNSKSALSNLSGEITYILQIAKGGEGSADVTRAIQGTLTGLKNGVYFEATFDFSFTYNRQERCALILKANSDKVESDTERCKGTPLKPPKRLKDILRDEKPGNTRAGAGK